MNKKRNLIGFIPHAMIIFVILWGMSSLLNNHSNRETSYSEFLKNGNNYEYKEVELNMWNTVFDIVGAVKTSDGKKLTLEIRAPKTEENIAEVTKILNEKGAKINVIDATQKVSIMAVVLQLLPMVLFGLLFMFFLSKNAGPGNDVTKSKARRETNVKVRFADVAALDEEKQEIEEVVDYLKNPAKYAKMGARVPKGVLLVGPPGTGKTLLAKAVAGEAKVPFYSISGSDFEEMFVGVGASRIRNMFKQVKSTAPAILFIDEIDAVGRKRGNSAFGSPEQTLNQLLVEMDGIGENTGIVIMAATNRVDVLDSALLRSGRFDRQIRVSLPDKKGRLEILKVHARNKNLAVNIDLEHIASRTPGFSGADLENVLNEAAILAVREQRDYITTHDLDEAIDRVMMGPAKKSKKYSEEEKRLVAYHEAGHAIIGIKLKDASRVRKITIIPRGEAGGYNLMTPEEERYFPTKRTLFAEIVSFMGGRVAEEIMFDDISAGASNDIQQSSRIARLMVKYYGMSELGPVLYADSNPFDGNTVDGHSEVTAAQIDSEVAKIIKEAHDLAYNIISENIELLKRIAEQLLENETITEEEIKQIVEEESNVETNLEVVEGV